MLEHALKTPLHIDPPDITNAAADAGLLDVAYATFDSPVGKLLLAATPRGLVTISYVEHWDEENVLQRLATRISPRILNVPRKLDDPRRQLDEYFEGKRTHFEIPLDWQLTHGFTRRVLEVTAAIPYGVKSTYKQVAAGAGSPRGSRAAGNALGSNPIPIVVPCHRVLHTGGGLGGYTGGVEIKRTLLKIESGQARLA
jgi:methylated-DNA-[protein]-cysteine S-methyltransferase